MNVNALNVHDIPSNAFAFICCDTANYPGYLTPSTVLSFALAGAGSSKTFPLAIILYSEQSTHCNFTIQGDSPVDAIFTTVDPMVATSLAKLQLSDSSPGIAEIVPDLNSDTANNSTSNNSGFGGFGGGGPSPTTAVAMIILYSITGIITALFVIIILTGAVRAHRHPERYGPRAGAAGRGGQSRAKGMARAMLATLPIVKYGDQEPTATKPPGSSDTDIEMNASSLTQSAGTEADKERSITSPEGQTIAQDGLAGQDPGNENNGAESAEQSSVKGEAPIAAIAVTNADGTQEDGSLGCSICTEDFTRGEEVRVLPCNHKFHPECVDPWLLNVSGTCPLCRIDLRGTSPNDESIPEEGAAALSPPLDTERQQSVDVANDFSPARSASMPSLIHMRNSTNLEERIAALRRLRNATRDSAVPEGGHEHRQGVTSRLRDRFRIRTTRAREPSGPVGDADADAERWQNAGTISALPIQGSSAPGPTELRPLREVYRLGRR